MFLFDQINESESESESCLVYTMNLYNHLKSKNKNVNVEISSLVCADHTFLIYVFLLHPSVPSRLRVG